MPSIAAGAHGGPGAGEARADDAATDGARSPRWLPPLVAAFLAPLFSVKVKTDDVFWHMATGRWIVTHGRLPDTDPFTYTMAGKPWRLVNGLADLVLYGAYRLGAESGLVVLKVLAAFCTLTLLGLCLRELRVAATTTVAMLAATALLLHGRYTMERPMILGGCLLAGCMFAAARAHRRHDRSHLVFLVALPIWPLVHGTALLGAVVLGSLLAAGVVARAPRRYLFSVAATAAACLVLTAVFPWWRDLYQVAAGVGGGATATHFTAEWQSGLDAAPDRVGHWIVLVVAVLGGLAVARADLSLLLLALTGAAISLRFGRNAYEGVLLAMPSFACALDRGAARLRERGSLVFAAALAPVAALAVSVVQLALAPFATIGGPFGFGLMRGFFPTDTLETLRRLPPRRVLNDFPIAGYLIWNDVPGGVYCDGRTVALYGEEDVRRLFLPLLESAEAVTAAADRWDAAYGLTQSRSQPGQWMMVSPDWIPVHLGAGTSLFVRSTHLAELPPEVKPLPLLRFADAPRWVDAWYRAIVADPRARAQLLTEMTEAARLSPGSGTLVDIVIAVRRIDDPLGEALAAVVDRAREAN